MPHEQRELHGSRRARNQCSSHTQVALLDGDGQQYVVRSSTVAVGTTTSTCHQQFCSAIPWHVHTMCNSTVGPIFAASSGISAACMSAANAASQTVQVLRRTCFALEVEGEVEIEEVVEELNRDAALSVLADRDPQVRPQR